MTYFLIITGIGFSTIKKVVERHLRSNKRMFYLLNKGQKIHCFVYVI